MDLFTALHTRRSVRSFTDEPLTVDEIQVLLDAAMIAPSAGNARPWQIFVVDDPTILATAPSINQYAGMVPKAAVGIVICGDLSLEKYSGFWVQDCSAATQNLLLAATGLGLGAVWTGIYPMEDRIRGFSQLLELPANVIPLALIAVGRTSREPERVSRYEPEKVHYNTFGTPWSTE